MLASTARRLPSKLAVTRALSTSSFLQSTKAPTIGDYTHTPQNTAAFKERLEKFHAAQKKAAARPVDPPIGSASAHGEHPKSGGIVKSILYGSEKGQREEAEMERSYSTVLARGKYVHAIEFHHVKPDKHAEYIKLVSNTYPEIAADRDNKCHLVGSWKTEVGDPDTFGEQDDPPF